MSYRGFSLIIVLALFATVAVAQQGIMAEVSEAGIHPPVESVLQHVPSGSLGFIVVNDVSAAVHHAGDFASNMAPDTNGDTLMEEMLDDMELGEGFNPNGGFAIVMLDPADFDFDLFETWAQATGMGGYDPYGDDVIEEEGFEEEGAEDVAEEDVDDSSSMVPAVFLVAGTSFEEIFPSMGGTLVADGEVTKIIPEYAYGTVFYTANQGSYVLLSPNKQAIMAVRNATDYVEMGLSQPQVDAINAADGAAFIDMTIATPALISIMDSFMELAMEEMPANGPYTVEDIERQLDELGDQLSQMENILATYAVAEKGISVQTSLAYVAGSEQAQLLASMPSGNRSLLNWLPNNNYVFAMGSVVNEPATMKDLYIENLKDSMAMAVYFSDETKEKIIAMADANYGTTSAVQMAVGGAPEGEGLFSVVMVTECDDAQAAMADLDDEVALLQVIVDDVVSYMQGEIPEFADFLAENSDENGEPLALMALSTESTDLTLKGVPLSKVVIDIPLLEKALEEEIGDSPIMAFLNKDLYTIWVAPVDATHVALVYGGGTSVMGQVIDAVVGTGTSIADDESLQAALAELPENPQVVMAFSLGNMGTVASQFQGMIEADQGGYPVMFPPFYMEDATPFVLTMNADADTLTASIFLSTDVFVDITESMGRMQQAMMTYYQEQENPPVENGNVDDEDTVEPEDEDF